MFDVAVITQILWTSLATSSTVVLFAIAFALVLKVNKVFNFAQAGVMTAAFYAAHVVTRGYALPGALGFATAIAGGVAAAWVLERFGFRTLRRRRASAMFVFIFTLVASQFITYVATLIFGTWPTTIFPTIFWPVTLVGGIAISAWDLPAMGGTLALAAALWAFLRFTAYGQFMTAVSDNADLAELYGIRKDRVMMGAMLIAGAICGAGMFMYGSRAQVQPAAATDLMLFAVAASILGGVGNIWGAAVAAVALGVVQNSSILFLPSAWQGFLLYAFLFVAIVVFPRGITLGEGRKAMKAMKAAPAANAGSA